MGFGVLELITNTYPSQITYYLGDTTFIDNEMVQKTSRWFIVINIFTGKLADVYLLSLKLWVEGEWLDASLGGIKNLVIRSLFF